MLTNETIRAIHENAVAHGFWEPDSKPTFSEYCALIHEEISEAFSAWRNNEPDEYIDDNGKPQGVWVELADVVIRCADAMAAWDCELEPHQVMIDLRKYSFGSYIAQLHWVVSKLWDVGDEKNMANYLSRLICVVYRFAEYNRIDLDAIIRRKCEYNKTRPYKHGKRM